MPKRHDEWPEPIRPMFRRCVRCGIDVAASRTWGRMCRDCRYVEGDLARSVNTETPKIPAEKPAAEPVPSSAKRKAVGVVPTIEGMTADSQRLSLAQSILGHREGRNPDVVLLEVEFAILGGSIDDIRRMREIREAG